MFDVRCSMFDVRCSMFDVRCSMFDVRRSTFDVRCSAFDVRCSMFVVCAIPRVCSSAYRRPGRGRDLRFRRLRNAIPSDITIAILSPDFCPVRPPGNAVSSPCHPLSPLIRWKSTDRADCADNPLSPLIRWQSTDYADNPLSPLIRWKQGEQQKTDKIIK